MSTSVDTDAKIGTGTKEPGSHTLAQDAPPAFLSLKAPSISNFGDELPLQFMFYEPRCQEPEPVVPKIWQDFGHVPVHNFSRHLSPIQSRSREYSSSQRRSCSTEIPSIPADASASYLELITSSARPSSRLESFLVREVPSISEHELKPKPVPTRENTPCLEPPSKSEEEHAAPRPEDKPDPSHETKHLTTLTCTNENTPSNDLTGQSISQTPVHRNSTTKSNNPQLSKDGSITSDDLFKLGVSYQFLSSTIDSDSNDNEHPPPKTPTPISLDRVPPPPSSSPPSLPPPSSSPQLPPPAAESPPPVLDDAFLSQEVPTKYLPVNAQLPQKMTWLDVLSLAQTVLACEEEPATNQVPVRTGHTVREVYNEEDRTAYADAADGADTDGHSLLAKSHVAEVENCVERDDNDDDGEDDDDVETIRSSFSSFNIRDVNLSLHKEVSRIWSWREKWRGRKGVGLGLGLGEKAF